MYIACLFVSQQEDVRQHRSPDVDLDHMDVDKEVSDGDDCEEPVDEDDREAPSEQDTDEAASKGESEHMEVRDDECESIHTQTSPRGFGSSPIQARVLDYAEETVHVTSLADEPAEEPHREVGLESAHDDEDDAEDDMLDDAENEHEAREEENSEGHPLDHEKAREEEQGDDQEDDREAVAGEGPNKADADKPASELPSTSRPASPSHHQDSGEELPPPSPPKPKASKRGKHKDRHSRRHSTRSQEPVITETLLEDKILGILSKTSPNVLSGLFQEAMGLSRVPIPQQAPQPAPTVEVAVGSAEAERVIDQVDVGVQGMEVDHVDGAAHNVVSQSTADTSDNEVADVSIRHPLK